MDKVPEDGTYGGYVSRMPNGGDPEDIVSDNAEEISVRNGGEDLELRFSLDNRVFSGTFRRDESVADGYFAGSLKWADEEGTPSSASAWFTMYWFDGEFFLDGEWLDGGVTYSWVVEFREAQGWA